MSWTYTGDPQNNALDEVRLMVGDTDTADKLIQDEEIDYILTQFPKEGIAPPWLAAAHVCDTIAGRFGRKAQRSVGSLSIAAQQQWEHYRDLAQQFRNLYATMGLSASNGVGAAVPAAPVLGGGGPTYLGPTPYDWITQGGP